VSNDPREPGTTTMDAAAHTFYRVSQEELVNAVRVLRDAAGAPNASTLSVHPTLASEGNSGFFGRALRTELLHILGESRLRRVTFMTVPVAEHEWTFGGFDVENGAPKPLRPFGVDAETQIVRGSATSSENVSARIEPAMRVDAPDVSPILVATRASITEDTAKRAYDAALRLENPRLTSTEGADCASCHLARSARVAGERHFGLTIDGRADAYGVTLAHEAGPSQSFRAFGYFGRAPSISPRAAHETNEVLRMLSDRVLGPR